MKHVLTGNYVIEVLENGTYTIGAKDYAGNWDLDYLTISNIDTEKPSPIMNLTLKYEDGMINAIWNLPDDDDLDIVKVKWLQEISDNSKIQEVLLTKNSEDFQFQVNKEINQCMVFVSVIDKAGNESNGMTKTINWNIN